MCTCNTPSPLGDRFFAQSLLSSARSWSVSANTENLNRAAKQRVAVTSRMWNVSAVIAVAITPRHSAADHCLCNVAVNAPSRMEHVPMLRYYAAVRRAPRAKTAEWVQIVMIIVQLNFCSLFVRLFNTQMLHVYHIFPLTVNKSQKVLQQRYHNVREKNESWKNLKFCWIQISAWKSNFI